MLSPGSGQGGSAVRYVSLLVLLTATSASALAGEQTTEQRPGRASVGKRRPQPDLEGCSIAILDLNKLAAEHDIPTCSLSNIVVDARTQVHATPTVDAMAAHCLREFSSSNREKRVIPSPHYFSGNSAPWFTRRAVERSPYYTEDVSKATVVLVDDYCFKLWWLSYIHSDKPDQLPGEHLFNIYEHMMLQPEWTSTLGSRHVFFQSHTGFAHGNLGDIYERFLCETLVNSMHIVNVRASRLRCKRVPYVPANLQIAPGSVHLQGIEDFQEQERERLAGGGAAADDRDFLLFFKGKCTPLNFTWKGEAVVNKIAQSTVNVGKLMRVHIVDAIQGMGRDVRAACTGDSGELKQVQNERPHWEQMDEFKRSTFCLLVSGDSQTSRRLPEAIMAGCIPVFPGPPYHTMPFADLIDYSQFALFFRFKKTPWADSITIHWEIDPKDPSQRPHHPTDSEWWVPDYARTKELGIEVENPQEMVQYLRDIPEKEVTRLQRALLAVQPNFSYQERRDDSQSAADLIVRAMCQRAKQQADAPPELVQPRELPESQIAKQKQRAATAKRRGGDGGNVEEADDGAVRVTRATPKSSDGDPARAVGDKHRQRRRNRQKGRIQVTKEHMESDGEWAVKEGQELAR